MSSSATVRRNMVDGQLRTFDVTDRAVIAAMDEVPRELFVAPGLEALAYLDRDLPYPDPTGEDPRAMLAPMVLGRMLQALALPARARVLDVAGGRGYASAVLALMGMRTTLLEPREELADSLAAAGISGVAVKRGPLAEGAPDAGPFDAILINGAVEEEPTGLLGQLVDGGRLACLGHAGRSGSAVLYLRSGETFSRRRLFDATGPILSAFRTAPAFAF